MRLRDRLAGLTAPRPPAIDGIAPALATPLVPRERLHAALPGELGRPERIARLRALIGEVVARDRQRDRPPAPRRGPQPLPFGETRETAAGPLHLVERWLPPQHCHGRVAVGGALQVEAGLLAALALDPALADVDVSRMLIIDTETTGLSGGAGTVPFLIGLGLFDEGVLKVEQLWLRDLGAEAPLLHHLAARMSGASVLVTYNGKAFDWPLLRARFVLNRVPLPEPPPHLDLLHCARRVLKARLGSVRLCEVEVALLGLRREDDIEGAEIPGRYLRYLRGEDPRTLLPVLAHNEQDVVALAALLWRLCAHFACVRAEDDPLDHLAYAKLALRGNDLARARAFAEAAISGIASALRGGAVSVRGSDAAQLRLEAQSLRARAARRSGDAQSAAHAWHEALADAHCERSAGQVHLALSRLYERELRDHARAHSHALFTLPAEGPEAHGRRLCRLQRKLQRMLR